MYELRIVEKNGKCGECAVWDKIFNIYINNDGIYFILLYDPNHAHFVSWDNIKHIKVVKK